MAVEVWAINALQPCILYDITHTVLLVSAVYMCDNGHEVPSTDPNIFQMIYPETHLPFVLLHRTGFTRGFLHIVIQLFVQGLPLSAIESFVSECRLNHCQSKLLCLKNELELCGHASNVTLECKAINLLRLPSPSNDILTKCFLTHFQQCKTAYEQAMSSLTTTSYILFDHTFKVASNIGYQRFDGHWINQYSSVFFVLNGLGQVLTWQFISSTSLNEVEPILEALCVRLKRNNIILQQVLVDNCCHVRNKIKRIFGEQANVSLDLFHAVQRLTRELSRFHPLYQYCINDLKLLFRDPRDKGNRRTMPTPDPEQLLTNANNFIQKWYAMEKDGKKLITEKFMKEFNSLKVHMSRGCLSCIPCGAGTNRNEALHRMINPHFRQSRIGLPLAFALMSILLYHQFQEI